jgi:diaminopimelate epimerase
MDFKFFKYHSNGNDFIILDNREKIFIDILKPQIIQNLCKREFYIGADGLVLLEKSDIADYKMVIYNSDGFEADMCGNALLCISKFLKDFIDNKNDFHIETLAGIYKTFIKEEKVFFITDVPKVIEKGIFIALKGLKVDIDYLNSGVFHGVIFLSNDDDNLEKIDVFKIGKEIRYHSIFQPKGVNVNFCKIVDNETLKVRTYEKGVENETYCCSTAALAVGYSYFLKSKMQKVKLSFKGGDVFLLKKNDKLILQTSPKQSFEGILKKEVCL